jgi:hypothetical protein
MSAIRFTFLGARFTPFHRRFTAYEGNSSLVSRSFHRCFIPTPFVSRFTPIEMKYETKPFCEARFNAQKALFCYIVATSARTRTAAITKANCNERWRPPEGAL